MNGIIAREDFNNAVIVFQKNFPRKDGTYYSSDEIIDAFKLTGSSLRLEQILTATTSTYTFPVLDNKPSSATGLILGTEIRLSMQDTFVPIRMGMFIGNPTGTADGAWRWYSYPNQDVFGASAVQMRALYNSTLEIMVNNYRYTYDWDMQKHWCSPQTQQTGAFGPGSPEDQLNGREDTYFPLQPFVLFGGLQNVKITLNIPFPPTAVLANSRIILKFDGVKAQNSTPANS